MKNNTAGTAEINTKQLNGSNRYLGSEAIR